MKVTVYTKDGCRFCDLALAILNQKKGLDISIVNLAKETSKIQEMVTKSGGLRTVPQIFFGDRHIGGYGQLKNLEETGQLDEMIRVNS